MDESFEPPAQNPENSENPKKSPFPVFEYGNRPSLCCWAGCKKESFVVVENYGNQRKDHDPLPSKGLILYFQNHQPPLVTPYCTLHWPKCEYLFRGSTIRVVSPELYADPKYLK
jgi:hypothetical protein